MRITQRLPLFALVAFTTSVALAEAQFCGGPGCNSTHTGCEFKQGSTSRTCCCDVHCNGLGCTCTDSGVTSCLLSCPSNCDQCSTRFSANSAPFTIKREAIDQLRREFPVAEMILANVSDRFKKPIVPRRVEGGTTVYNAPRGYRYKAKLDATKESLTFDMVFLSIPPDPKSSLPPQVEEPSPGPTRIEITDSGIVAISPLPDSDAKALVAFTRPNCDATELARQGLLLEKPIRR
jgi:hypothetical protein